MSAPASRRRPERRDVHGILVLDKPAGISSNQALQRVRWLLRARKGGHTGSLDPAATGMLPLCFGEATKVSAFLLEAEKEYLVRARLGERRDTGDIEGQVIDTAPVPVLDASAWQEVLVGFTGSIEQVPPMYSALKQGGQRLYELARAGQEVERAPRTVRIHALQLVAQESGDLVLRVRCSKGTYIRTLVEDIARAAGTLGYTRALRRVTLGPFRAEQMVTMERLERDSEDALVARLLPPDAALAGLPAVTVSEAGAPRFLQGQQTALLEDAREGEFRVYSEDGSFLGVGRVPCPGVVRPKRVFSQR